MKSVNFKNVFIKNFLSIGDKSLSLDFTTGITVITGENKDKGGKNGIGKSTIADAIYWCLFGNTIRELKKDKIQHNKNQKECQVILKFSVNDGTTEKEYQIDRVLNPSKIKIICDKQDITLSTLPKNDEFIKTLIGANEEVFNNAVIMSANNTVPFMAQKKTEKRKFIEGILQLNVFSEMLLKTRGDYNDSKKENDLLSDKFVNLQKNLSIFNEQKNNAEKDKQSRIDGFKLAIKEGEKEINRLKSENNNPSIEELEKQVASLQEKNTILRGAYKNFNKKSTEALTKIHSVSTEIKILNTEKQKILDKGDTCPTCNRKYCEDDIKTINARKKQIDDDIKEHQKKLNVFNEEKKSIDNEIEKIEEGLTKIDNKIQEIEKTKKTVNNFNRKIGEIEKNIYTWNSLIKDLEKKKESSVEENIKNTSEEIKTVEKRLQTIKKQLNILETAKFIVSEEGVKTYIVKKIINVLNNRLNYYLQKLDTPCKCVFDEMFEETIYNEQGKEVSYFNFSGGERKRIDTAILFTFQDVMRFHSGTSFSLNIYDELLDCALDSQGTDKILEILKDKVEKYQESVYIVSHKHSDIANIDKIIFLEKKDGVTSIIS